MFWWGFLVGIFVGVVFGVFIMCFCFSAGAESRRREKEEYYRFTNEYNEEMKN